MQQFYITVDGLPVNGFVDESSVEQKLQDIQTSCPDDLVMKHAVRDADHRAHVQRCMGHIL